MVRELTDFEGAGLFVPSVEFSPDGKRMVTRSTEGAPRVWDTATWSHLPGEPIPEGVKSNNVLPDGRVVKTHLFHATIESPPSEAELARRRWLARPSPERHARLAKEYEKDPFASAVQKSLEQKAHGQLAMEAGDFQQAFGHFLAAEILRPKPVSPDIPKK
jgi:hypothetical protein